MVARSFVSSPNDPHTIAPHLISQTSASQSLTSFARAMITAMRYVAAVSLVLIWLMPAPLLAQGSSTLAPILVEPYDGEDVVENQIAWTWFMQSRTSDGEQIFCDLIVVEVLEGQTAEEA